MSEVFRRNKASNLFQVVSSQRGHHQSLSTSLTIVVHLVVHKQINFKSSRRMETMETALRFKEILANRVMKHAMLHVCNKARSCMRAAGPSLVFLSS